MKFWEENAGLYRARLPRRDAPRNDEKGKKYILVEFPYPSGSGLHVGHAFSFTAADIYARFKRMQGYNVMFPMGWDAFGLPTENYAIKMKRKPQEVTKENTDMFRSQMKKLAFSFDWEREVNTTDPAYYKWTQWIFIQLFKKGLAYKKEMPINWCPSCKIGLANEEVVDSKCERCGAEVSRRNISQWVVKITDYAERLLDGLKDTDFIDKVKTAQVNWIGKSEGAKIRFVIARNEMTKQSRGGSPRRDAPRDDIDYLEVFTTRPDTIYGATFMVVAPEHALVQNVIARNEMTKQSRGGSPRRDAPRDDVDDVKNYVLNARKKSDMERTEVNREKTGVFSGLYAINPATGKEIPIWVSDFVLAGYGTGAIMSVPAHDERDMAFAKKYGLPVIKVVDDDDKMINSDMLNGLVSGKAFEKMIKWLKEKGIGERTNSYHLRDWIFSRQHYWGEPIPMIWCENCAKNQSESQKSKVLKSPLSRPEADPPLAEKGDLEGLNFGWFPVPEDQLPIKLPEVEAYEPTEDGMSPLSKIESFVKCKCPVCGGEAKRETDTMPNWAGSDWYYLAYLMSLKSQSLKVESNNKNIFLENYDKLKEWMPVDVYIGGDEHNTLHLLYSRFIYQFLWDLGMVPKEYPEPYIKRVSHGVILGPDGQRMSKSKGNIIVPEKVSEVYGVDVVRCYLMFMGPFDAVMAWNEKTLMGVKRFLDRFSKFVADCHGPSGLAMTDVFASKDEVKVIVNKMIKGVTDDLNDFGYNTAIAKMMEGTNQLRINNYQLTIGDIKILIKLIAPFAPYLSEELWASCAKASEGQDPVSVHISDWPVAEEKFLVEKTITIAIAINGKVRDQLLITNYELRIKEDIIAEAKKLEKIKKWIEGKKIVKEIYVPGKMVNLVVTE